MNTSLLRRGTTALALTIGVVSVSHPALAAKKKPKSAKEVNSIEEYIGGNGGDQQKQILRKINEAVQKCMKAEGFDYQIPPDSNVAFPDATDAGSQKEFAKKYGYGISTTFDPNVIENPNKDPNVAIRSKLSPADQKAYDKALTGNPAAGPTGDPKACTTKALSFLGDLPKLIALFGKYDANVTKRIDANPKVVAAMKQWSSCMKEKGFTYAKDSDIQGDLAGRLTKITGAGVGLGPLAASPAVEPKKIDRAALSKLQKEEIATAVRDFECTEKHLKVRNEIKRDLDRDFITANQSAVDGVRDALGG
jgi:hypothetical protein